MTDQPAVTETVPAGPAVGLHRRRRLWLALAVLGGVLGIVLSPGLLSLLGIVDHRAWFLDTYAILAACDAQQQGLDPFQPNPLDVYSRAHVYTHWWFVLGRIGLTRDDNFLLGTVTVGLFFLAALLPLKPRSRVEWLGLLSLLLAPPVLLGVNRANNDLLRFSCIGFGLWLATQGNRERPAWLGGAVALATGLKFYPVVAAAATLVLRPVRRAWLWTSALAAVSLLVLVNVSGDLARAPVPTPVGAHVFGAAVFWRNLGNESMLPVVASLLVLSALAVALALRGWTRGLGESRSGPLDERLGFLTAVLLLLACYASGISYAYRWVFAIWLAPWLWRQAWGEGLTEQRPAARLTFFLLTALLWFDGLYCLVVNIFFWPMSKERIARWESNCSLLVQPLVWTLMLLLAGWLADALLAAWRDRAAD